MSLGKSNLTPFELDPVRAEENGSGTKYSYSRHAGHDDMRPIESRLQVTQVHEVVDEPT